MSLDRRLHFVSVMFGYVIVTGAAFAPLTHTWAAEPQGGALSVCAGDLSTLCPSIEAGNGKKMRCLMEHQAQLSPNCDTAVKVRVQARGNRLGGVEMAQAQMMPAAGGAAPAAAPATPPSTAPVKLGKSGRINKKACKVELATLCSTTTSSRTKCLIANQSKLGPECAATVAVGQQAREVAKAACVMDAAKLCGPARGAQRVQCLEANKAQLSPSCLARIEKREVKKSVRDEIAPGTPKQ